MPYVPLRNIKAILVGCVIALSLAGCSFPTVAPVAAASNVYSSYGDRIPGKYLLIVEPSGMSATVRPVGVACSAHNYPIDAGAAFSESVRATIAQVVDDVEPVQTGIPPSEMRRAGIAGVIRVRSTTFQPRLTFIPSTFSATAQSTIDVAASLEVDGPNGRLLGTSVGANRTSDMSVGECPGGSQALAAGVQTAMRDLMERLGERLANAPRVRDAALQSQRRGRANRQ